MATLSHEAFRRMIEKFGGCDEYFTEMINAGSLLTRGPFEKFYLINETVPQKMVWQLTGSKTPLMIEAASFLAGLGGIGIDLNMGCCAPEIVSSGAGIAWMLKPVEETRAMVRGVREAIDKTIDKTAGTNNCKLRLSVKLRLGDEDFTDDGFFSFCDMLIDEGVEQLTLHPRTRKQKYTRPARWQYVQKLAERVQKRGVRVILNGDVKDVDSARCAIQAAPAVDGIMIARAACQKPWVFAQIAKALAVEGAEITTDSAEETQKIDLLELVYAYLDDLQVYQPNEFWKTRYQRFFTYFCDNFSFAHYAKTQLVNSADIEQVKERLAQYFEKVSEDRFLTI